MESIGGVSWMKRERKKEPSNSAMRCQRGHKDKRNNRAKVLLPHACDKSTLILGITTLGIIERE